MGCSTCGKKYPRSSSGMSKALTANTRMSEVPTILTKEQKKNSYRGVIKKMKTSKGMIQPEPLAAVPGTEPDCGPIIPATGQPESWVTKGTQGAYAEKMESPMNTTLTVDNRAQGKVDE